MQMTSMGDRRVWYSLKCGNRSENANSLISKFRKLRILVMISEHHSEPQRHLPRYCWDRQSNSRFIKISQQNNFVFYREYAL